VSRRFPLSIPVAVILLIAMALASAPAIASIGVGDEAAPFTLADASGQSVTLASLRGQIVILDFTASWCTACRTALPALERLGLSHAGRGVSVVTVTIDTNRRDADRFLAEVVPGATMRVLYDPTGRTLARYGAAGMPAHYVLDRAGIVRFVASGYTADRMGAIDAVVTRLLAADAASATP
jgi:thiol-disulfide isomerase/thioredoxin